MRRNTSELFVHAALLVALTTSTSAAAQPTNPTRWLLAPPNPAHALGLSESPRLTFQHPGLKTLLEDASRRSPFLRHQIQRLIRTQRLSLSIDVVSPRTLSTALARTRIESLPDGTIRAAVAIGLTVDTIGLMGHEFEHILERLDGVHVQRRNMQGDVSTRRSASHAFETDRAVYAGRVVTAEYLGRRKEMDR